MGNNRGNTDDGLMMNNVIRMPCDVWTCAKSGFQPRQYSCPRPWWRYTLKRWLWFSIQI